MPLYNTTVDFNSDNQDVIKVQSFSFRSKLLFFFKSIALIIYVCGYLPSVFSSISEKYVLLGCDQMTSLVIDGHLIIYPIPFLCLEQVWVWLLPQYALVHYSFSQHLSESDQRWQLCTSSKNTSSLFPLAALAFVNTLCLLNSERLPYSHILNA